MLPLIIQIIELVILLQRNAVIYHLLQSFSH